MKTVKKILFVAIFLISGLGLRAQSTGPTMEETASWIKNTILAYGNDVKLVEWNGDTHNLTIGYSGLIKTVPTSNGDLYYFYTSGVANYISNLSTANIVWKSDDDGVEIEIYAVDGKNGSTIIKVDRSVGKYPSGADAKALSDPVTENRPVAKIAFKTTFGKDMQERFAKAIKRLIYLSGDTSIVYPSPGNSGQNIIKDGRRFLCGNSYFKKTGDNSWGEFKLFSQNPLFNFSVIENTPTYKILYDASRKTYVKLTYNEGFWGYNLDNISTKLGNGFWTEVK